ncbi:MAG: sulfatase-like hydrolase/transferase [Thermoanaerobaculia bacterium]|nr:sulfatase-like hydrolase/transferase [Thermoanaerobaculia bacterium]
MRPTGLRFLALLLLVHVGACGPSGDGGSSSVQTSEERPGSAATADQPSILLVTLDTTRADSVEPESTQVATPALAALAAAGRRYSQAYATVPITLPSHVSIFTGLYPGDHGVHENSRPLAPQHELLAERLQARGYQTAAFVSGFPLVRQFGLARGFDEYEDNLGSGLAERGAEATTDLALSYLERAGEGPLLLWVHYYDAHAPYDPPEPFRSDYSQDPYLGEIASMDHQLGRLVAAFESLHPADHRIIVVGDHGEGRGDHGEMLHGNLLYQGVLRVPLVIAGSGIEPSLVQQPVSTRSLFDLVSSWAEGDLDASITTVGAGVVLAEAMKPHLQYGWQPQVAGVAGSIKVIKARGLEVYDLAQDPEERHNLDGDIAVNRELLKAIADYPLPAKQESALDGTLSEEDRRTLASLGYAGAGGRAPERRDAPDPSAMAHLFADLDRGSELFVQGEYGAAIPILERLLAADPQNFMVSLRLAVAHSVTGHLEAADEGFRRAAAIDSTSLDLSHYHALHLLRIGRWQEARPLLEAVVRSQPERAPALEGLAEVRRREGRTDEALSLLDRATQVNPGNAVSWLQVGRLEMEKGRSEEAVAAFERARSLQQDAFVASLDLGVCYLALGRFEEARQALDRVAVDHPAYPLALFKRAQVSVLLNEPDSEDRVRSAYLVADPNLRRLIENERLFAGISLP